MKIQTTPVLRLLTDYSHSQTIYRLHTASLKLPPDYLNSQKTISILRPLQYSEHSQTTPRPLPIFKLLSEYSYSPLQTSPRLLPVYSYSQTTPLLKLIMTTPILHHSNSHNTPNPLKPPFKPPLFKLATRNNLSKKRHSIRYTPQL